MADTTKAANPDKELSWDEKVKKLVGQAEQIAKAAETVALIARDREGKEIKPATDVCGQSRITAMALRSDYIAQMKEYGGLPDLADHICSKTTRLRRVLSEAAKLAHDLAQDAQDANTNLDMMGTLYAQANAPKIQARLAKEEAAAKKTAERIDKLKKAAAGSTRRKANG